MLPEGRNTVSVLALTCHVGCAQPLPRRLLITYREEEGQPQFRARFLKWDTDTALDDALFVHEPADGAEEIPFIAPQSLPTGTGGAQ